MDNTEVRDPTVYIIVTSLFNPDNEMSIIDVSEQKPSSYFNLVQSTH